MCTLGMQSIDNLRHWIFVRDVFGLGLQPSSLTYFSSKTTFHTWWSAATCCLSIAVWYYIDLLKWIWMFVFFCDHRGPLFQKPNGIIVEITNSLSLLKLFPCLSPSSLEPVLHLWSDNWKTNWYLWNIDQTIEWPDVRATLHSLLPVQVI